MSEWPHGSGEMVGRSDEKYRVLFESIDTGFCIIEVLFDAAGRPVDYVFLDANPAFEGQTGLVNAIGQRIRKLAPEHEEFWFETYGRIARTGQPERFEHRADALGRWYNVYAFRFGPPEQHRVAILFEDIKERKWAEAALRAREERQAFLLKLSDLLRPHSDPDTIATVATHLVAAHLQVDRCYVARVSLELGRSWLSNEFRKPELTPIAGEYRLDDFPDAIRTLATEPLFFTDVQSDPNLSKTDKSSLAAMDTGAVIAAPLRQGQRNFIWAFVVAMRGPRRWSRDELLLLEETAERTWAAMERARAETALRESDERFRQFAEASSGALWIRDANTLAMEYVSPANARIYGVEPGAFLGDIKFWASAIVPEDREAALDHIEQARRGESVVHEFRIFRPSDQTFRWIRNISFPLRDEQGSVERIGGVFEDVTDSKLAVEHQGVLLAELQHRVRNIMAIMRSITTRTAERAENVQEYAGLMVGRLLALARVQALLTRAANVNVSIRTLVEDEVSAQSHQQDQCVFEGPDVALSPKAAEILTLAVHELATNALKHGALCVPSGRVNVRWNTFEKSGATWLDFNWTEQGAPPQSHLPTDKPRRRGFGIELIEGRIPYELGGVGRVTLEPDGARCHLEFPLKDGASVLVTGAPQRATVFGGALDMTGEPDLSARRILVVEDDYYIAADTVRTLQGAGARVIGPCSTEAAARAELTEQRPEAVVLDINLGLGGPSFTLAETLLKQNIPFVFLTGYDSNVIPERFQHVERLEKPVQLRLIVGVIAKLLDKAAPPPNG